MNMRKVPVSWFLGTYNYKDVRKNSHMSVLVPKESCAVYDSNHALQSLILVQPLIVSKEEALVHSE